MEFSQKMVTLGIQLVSIRLKIVYRGVVRQVARSMFCYAMFGKNRKWPIVILTARALAGSSKISLQRNLSFLHKKQFRVVKLQFLASVAFNIIVDRTTTTRILQFFVFSC